MAGSRNKNRGKSSGRRRGNSGGASRTARVGELIRRIIAEELDGFDDERLAFVSITSVDVDRELHRAVIWFTTLDGEDDGGVEDALEEYRSQLRRAVSSQARLRHTPELEFRSDETLRSAERIESLLRHDERPPVPELDPDTYEQRDTLDDSALDDSAPDDGESDAAGSGDGEA